MGRYCGEDYAAEAHSHVFSTYGDCLVPECRHVASGSRAAGWSPADATWPSRERPAEDHAAARQSAEDGAS